MHSRAQFAEKTALESMRMLFAALQFNRRLEQTITYNTMVDLTGDTIRAIQFNQKCISRRVFEQVKRKFEADKPNQSQIAERVRKFKEKQTLARKNDAFTAIRLRIQLLLQNFANI